MISVMVLTGAGVMASSLAVTTDVLETANRVAERLGKPPPFELRCCAAEAPGDAGRVIHCQNLGNNCN